MTVDIICADSREALARFPDGHFHCCVSSPPFWGLRDYGLEPTVWGGDGCEHEWGEDTRASSGRNDSGEQRPNFHGQLAGYGGPRDVSQGAFCRRCNAWRGTLGLEPTPELYVEHLVSVLREVRRVLRDDGTLWLDLGDSYCSQPAGNIEPSGFSQTRPSRRKHGVGPETVDLPQRRWNGLKPKDLVGVPWRVAFALQADGWWLRSDIIWSKPNPMPESVTDRPTRAHEYLFLLTKSQRYYYDADAIREPHTDESAKRYLRNSSYTGDPNATQYAMKQGPRGHGMPSQKWEAKEADAIAPTWVKGHSGYVNADGHVMINEAGRNRRSVWEIATQPYPDAHFATFPEKLVEPCILAGTSEWGCCPECGAPWERCVESGDRQRIPRYPSDEKVRETKMHGPASWNTTQTTGWRPTCKHGAEPVPCRVLDPFAGSGTVGLVAERLGRHSVLIDAKEEYCEMARHRTAQRGLMLEAK